MKTQPITNIVNKDNEKINKFIKDNNYNGLKNYLKRNRVVIENNSFQNAYDNAVSMNDIDSRMIMAILYPFLWQPQYKADYRYQEVSKSFANFEKAIAHRESYKIIDRIIEKDLIYPIKYPGALGFVRWWLKIPSKRDANLSEEALLKKLPKLIEDIKNSIKSTSNTKLTENEINIAIYERLSLKVTQDLKLRPEILDTLLKQLNNAKLSEAQPDNLSKVLLNNMIPPHLITMYKLSSVLQGERFKNAPSFVEVLNDKLKALELQIKELKDSPGRETLLKSTIANMMDLNNEIVSLNKKYPEYAKSHLTEENINHYTELLDNTQQRIDERLKQSHNKHKLSKGLTEFEKQAISLIDFDYPEDMPLNRKTLIANFFENALGNTGLNKRLGSLLAKIKSKPDDNSFSEEEIKTIEILHKFTYKSSNLDQIIGDNGINNKLKSFLKNMTDDPQYAPKDPKEKLTYDELGKLLNFVDTKMISSYLLPQNLVENSPKLQAFIKGRDESDALIQQLKNMLESKAIDYKPGDIIMEEAEKKHALSQHHNLSFKNKVQDWITPFNHAALIGKVNKKDNKAHLSEVMAAHRKVPVDPLAATISQTFRVFPDKLLNKQHRDIVSKVLEVNSPAEVKSELSKMYQGIMKKLNSEIKSNTSQLIINNEAKRKDAGFADFIPGGHTSKEPVRGWADRVLEQKNVGQMIRLTQGKGEKEENSIICSEFAAKMTVLALVKLEEELVKKIQEKHPEYQLPKESLIKLPFSKNEDLSKVHPARLVKELDKHGAIEKIAQPNIQQFSL